MQQPSFENIRNFIVAKVAPATAPADADKVHLIDAGILDSVGFVNLIASIEEHFGMEVDFGDADPDEFLTIGGLARCASASAQSHAGSGDV